MEILSSMVITFYGEDCFKIQSGELVILVDPIDSKSGLNAPRFKYDALLKTLSPFPPESAHADSSVDIAGPGEYNFKEAKVSGFLMENESSDKFIKTIYVTDIEEIKIALLGYLSEIPAPSIMEHLEEIDILFVPAGGKPFMEQKSVIKLIRQIQPKIVIPTLYKLPGLKRQTDDLKKFLEEFNHGKTEPQEKLTIKKKDLTSIKPSQLVILKV